MNNDEIFTPGIVKPEEDYLELERLSKKLGIPVPMMYVNLKSINPDGTVAMDFTDRSRTYNRNFWNMTLINNGALNAGTATFGAGFYALKTTGGAVNALGNNIANGAAGATFNIGSAAAIASTLFGIIVGTSNTAESFDGTAMGAAVATGNGAGQLAYNAQSASSASYNSGTKTWTVSLARVFNNNSGGTITIAETGLYTAYYPNGQSYLMERSVLGTPVAVANAGQLTVTYSLSLTFPA